MPSDAEYDEYVLEKKGILGWSGIGAYPSEEEARSLLDNIRKKELPFARSTYRIYKRSFRTSNIKEYPGNVDPYSSNPDRNFDTSQIPDFDYKRPYQ